MILQRNSTNEGTEKSKSHQKNSLAPARSHDALWMV